MAGRVFTAAELEELLLNEEPLTPVWLASWTDNQIDVHTYGVIHLSTERILKSASVMGEAVVGVVDEVVGKVAPLWPTGKAKAVLAYGGASEEAGKDSLIKNVTNDIVIHVAIITQRLFNSVVTDKLTTQASQIKNLEAAREEDNKTILAKVLASIQPALAKLKATDATHLSLKDAMAALSTSLVPKQITVEQSGPAIWQDGEEEKGAGKEEGEGISEGAGGK